MGNEITTPTEASAPVVLRMRPEMKAQLMKLAVKNGRSLSKEIVLRLEQSLKIPPDAFTLTLGTPVPVPGIREGAPAPYAAAKLNTFEQAMLEVFRALPAEKQLALLSLFK